MVVLLLMTEYAAMCLEQSSITLGLTVCAFWCSKAQLNNYKLETLLFSYFYCHFPLFYNKIKHAILLKLCILNAVLKVNKFLSHFMQLQKPHADLYLPNNKGMMPRKLS